MIQPNLADLSPEIQEYIHFLDETIKKLTMQCDHQTQHNMKLTEELARLSHILDNLRKQHFGPKSEKTPKVEDGQLGMDIFNEVEALVDPKVPDELAIIKTTDVKAYKRRTVGYQAKLLEGFPLNEQVFEVTTPTNPCPKCGSEMVRVGKTFLYEEVDFIPPQFLHNMYYEATYTCKECEDTVSEKCATCETCACEDCKERPRKVFVKAPVPIEHLYRLFKHSLASVSLVAWVMIQKYMLALPLDRQAKEFTRLGLKLNTTTLANWVIEAYDRYLKQPREAMREKLLESIVVHCDESPIQVLNVPGKQPQSKQYMWVYRNGVFEPHPIIIFDYNPSRAGKCARDFLKADSLSPGDVRYIVTDDYGGYNKVPNYIRCECWSHMRRMFIDAMPKDATKDELLGTNAQIGKDFCDQLFMVERKLKDLSPEERFKERLKLSQPVLDAFFAWVETFGNPGKTGFGEAINHARSHKKLLMNFLLDGHIPVSNNADENAIRPFVIGRKNWLFSKCEAGARASAGIYSIIETAKANHVDPYRYLMSLLKRMIIVVHTGQKVTDWEPFMPWNFLSPTPKPNLN